MPLLRVYRSEGEPGGANAPAPAPAPQNAPEPPAEKPSTPPAPAKTAEIRPAPAAPPAPSDDPLAALRSQVESLQTQVREQTRARVIAEVGIKGEAMEFITAPDEAGMRAQAEKIKSFAPITIPSAPSDAPKTPPAPPAGTATNPAATPPATLDEQIAAAEKAGNPVEAIRLKRQRMFGA